MGTPGRKMRLGMLNELKNINVDRTELFSYIIIAIKGRVVRVTVEEWIRTSL